MSKFKVLTLAAAGCVWSAATVEAQQPRIPMVPKSAASTQKVPAEGSLWHALGVPQGLERMRKFRDSQVNRDGNNPGAERKPQLKPIADAEFLKEGANPLLAAAAKAKQENDLAPQKIKALKYIASLGCGCGENFEAAIIAGLEDCVEEVRAEAAQAVITAAGGNCSCQCVDGGLASQRRVRPAAGLTSGGVSMSLTDCPPYVSDGCSVCGSCCTYNIQKELKKLAFETDADNCPKEPSPRVRALAQQALQLCPPRENPDKKTEDKKEEFIKPRQEGGERSGENTPGSQDSEDSLRRKLEAIERILREPNSEALPPPVGGEQGSQQSSQDAGNRAVTFSLSDQDSDQAPVPPIYLQPELDLDLGLSDDFSLECSVRSSSEFNRLSLEFDRSYTLPKRVGAMLTDANGTRQVCEIVASQPGRVTVQAISKDGFRIDRQGNLRIAVLE